MKSWRDAPLANEPAKGKPEKPTKGSWRDAPIVTREDAPPVETARTPPSISKAVGSMPSFDIGRPGTYLPGAARAVLEVPVGLERGVQDVAETLLSPLFPRGPGTVAAAEKQQFANQFGKSPVAMSGRFVGQTVATAPAGSVLAAPFKFASRTIPAIKGVTTPIATSLESGGFMTGAQPKTFYSGAANIGTRMIGGGAAGATGAALTDQDAGTGAVAGALIPGVGVPLTKASAKGLGTVFDSVSGKLGKVRASTIIRDVLGPDADKAINILRNAPDNLTPEQALIEGGVKPLMVKGFIALGEWAAKRDKANITRLLGETQEEQRQTLLNIVSGGETATRREAAQETAKQALSARTGPLREQAIKEVKKTQQITSLAQRKVAQESEVIANLRQQADDLTTRVDEATKQAAREAEELSGVGGGGGVAPDYTEAGQQAAALKAQGAELNKQIKNAERRAATAQAKLDDLALKGVTPLDANRIAAPILNLLTKPRAGVSDVTSKALRKVAQKLNEWSSETGIIDPEALIEIRQKSITEAIREAMPGVDAKTQNAQAVALLSEVRPFFDSAMKQAGAGKTWFQYLRTYEEGMKDVSRMKLASEAAEMYASNPNKFVALVRGNDPEAVKNLFGPRQGDFMAAMDPTIKLTGRQKSARPIVSFDRRPAMQEVARQVERDAAIKEQVTEGYEVLQNAFRSVEPGRLGVPSLLNRAATIANVALEDMEKRFSKQTMDIIIKSMRSGKGVVEAVSLLPASERSKMLKFLSGKANINAPAAGFATSGAAGAVAAEPNRNAMRR